MKKQQKLAYSCIVTMFEKWDLHSSRIQQI